MTKKPLILHFLSFSCLSLKIFLAIINEMSHLNDMRERFNDLKNHNRTNSINILGPSKRHCQIEKERKKSSDDYLNYNSCHHLSRAVAFTNKRKMKTTIKLVENMLYCDCYFVLMGQ